MAITMRVRGLTVARKTMLRTITTLTSELPPEISKAMAEVLVREIIKASKRPGHPRTARFRSNKGGGATVEIGWYGSNFSAVDDYIAGPMEAARRRGFRRAVARVRAWFRRAG